MAKIVVKQVKSIIGRDRTAQDYRRIGFGAHWQNQRNGRYTVCSWYDCQGFTSG